MKYFVLGCRRLDIPASADRGAYHGIKCFVAVKNSTVIGWETDAFSIRDDLLFGKMQPVPGCTVDIEFRKNSSSVGLVNGVYPPEDIAAEDLAKTSIDFVVNVD